MVLPNADQRTCASRFDVRRSATIVAVVTHLLTAIATSAVVLAPSTAFADEPSKRKVVAVYVEGSAAAEARDDILSVLPDNITVADKGDVTTSMRKFGLSKPMGSAMTQAKSRKGFVPRLRKAAKDAGADGFIVGIVQRYSGKWRVYVVWLNGDSDSLLVDEAVSREGSQDERRSALKSALSSAIAQFAPQGATTNSTVDKPSPDPNEVKKDDEEDSSDKPKRVRHEISSSILNVEAGIEVTGRKFDFSDGLTTNLRGYNLFGAPVFFAALEVYPAGFTTIPVLRDIGLTGSYARAFALQSATADGTPINTMYQRYSVGLHVRIPISRPTGPILGVSGQYYVHTFHVDETAALKGQIPNVDYHAIRAGADGRFPIGRTAIMLGFDWIEPLSSGQVYGRFTGAKVHGVGGKLGFVVKIAGGFELRLAGEYSRFFSDFDPVLGDTYVAGGALDQYFGIKLSGAYVE